MKFQHDKPLDRVVFHPTVWSRLNQPQTFLPYSCSEVTTKAGRSAGNREPRPKMGPFLFKATLLTHAASKNTLNDQPVSWTWAGLTPKICVSWSNGWILLLSRHNETRHLEDLSVWFRFLFLRFPLTCDGDKKTLALCGLETCRNTI